MSYYAVIGSDRQGNVQATDGKLSIVPYFWNADTLAYEVATVNATTGTGQEVVVTNVPPVSQSGAWTVGLSSGVQTIGTVAQGSPGSSANPWWMRETNPSTGGGAGSTTVDVATLPVSTRHVGDVSISSGSVNVSSGVVLGPSTAAIGSVSVTSGTVLGPSTALVGLISSGTQTIGTVLNASSTGTIGNVSVSSGVILGASTASVGLVSSGTQTIGTVLNASSTVTIGNVSVSSGVVLGPSTAAIGQLTSGTQTIGTVLAGTSTNLFGSVQERPASGALRTSAASSVDVSLLAANTGRIGAIINNFTTGSDLLVGLSTVLVSSVSYSFKTTAGGQTVIGPGGNVPNFTGAIRGRLLSTSIAGTAYITELTST